MISLVSYGTDSNAAGDSQFCGFVQPIGIEDGDLVIVCVAVADPSITIAPPSPEWTQIGAQTDVTQPIGLVAFWTTALNLPSNIVFEASAIAEVSGVLMAYRGADAFAPVEVSGALLTASASTHNVAGLTAALHDEAAVLFLASGALGTYTPASGFQLAARKQQASSTLEAQHRPLPNAGPLAAFSETFSSPAAGASLLILLAPSPSQTTYADAYDRIFEMLPQGIDNVLDFTQGTGDFYKIVWVIGALFKTYQFDVLDIARNEVVPYLSRYMLPIWERVFGLASSRTAQLGTIPQRQQQVLGFWRAAAGQSATLDRIRATVGPLLGYNPTTTAEIVEADASNLKLQHSYMPQAPQDYTVTDGGSADVYFYVSGDGGRISNAGVQLEIQFDTGDLDGVTLSLFSPSSHTATWAKAWTRTPLRLFAATEFADSAMQGYWRLHIENASGSTITLYDGAQLRVAGMGRNKQSGGAIFTWGVLVDWAAIGESGTPADFAAALRAIKKLAQSHTIGSLLQSAEPWPGETVGEHAAIPGQCIPT